MVNQYAVVEDGRVVNIVLAEQSLADNWVKSKKARMGDIYSGGKFSTPEPVSTKPGKKSKIEALIDVLVLKGALSEDDAAQIKMLNS